MSLSVCLSLRLSVPLSVTPSVPGRQFWGRAPIMCRGAKFGAGAPILEQQRKRVRGRLYIPTTSIVTIVNIVPYIENTYPFGGTPISQEVFNSCLRLSLCLSVSLCPCVCPFFHISFYVQIFLVFFPKYKLVVFEVLAGLNS